MAAKFEIKKTSAGKFMFNLKAANGQIVLTSQQYQDKSGAKDGIASVQKCAAKDANYEKKTSAKGEPYFVLLADNREVIGKSEMYSSAKAMEGGIASVKANAPMAAVEDLSA